MKFLIGKQNSVLSFTRFILISSGSESNEALGLRTREFEKSLPYQIGDGYSFTLSSRNTLSMISVSFITIESVSDMLAEYLACTRESK